jgi:hypothetical protein
MAYKEKTCPRCGTKHTKRGEYCSRSCGNVREWNKEQRQSVSDGLRQWHATSETAEVAAHNFISAGRNKTPDPVAPPVRVPLESNQFIADGCVWTDCD